MTNRLAIGLLAVNACLAQSMFRGNAAHSGVYSDEGPRAFHGVKWKFATPLPLVPYVKAAGGLVFAFPNGATNSAGLAIRAGGGANYFFFDWLGLGALEGYPGGLDRRYVEYRSVEQPPPVLIAQPAANASPFSSSRMYLAMTPASSVRATPSFRMVEACGSSV